MKTVSIVKALFALLASALFLAASAQPAIPPLSGHVNDLSGTLSAEQKANLEQRLQNFEAGKGSQLVVLIVPSTGPESIEQYALRVVEQWKPGRKKIDDGALLIVAKNDRSLRIEVGYGLEGTLTDASSKRIVSEVIVPQFKRGEYYAGISAGVESMMQVIAGESLPPPKANAGNGDAGPAAFVPVIFILTVMLGGLLRAVLGRFPGALLTAGASAILAWLLAGALSLALLAGVLAFMFTLFGGGMRGLGGMHSSGRSGTYGGGGGGFSGGGGGFGGGGASGRW
ncbi:MAG: YgcG family protein [Burkholderiales bacterium]|nr:YgcG family protein [Burkholderiales bacterium]